MTNRPGAVINSLPHKKIYLIFFGLYTAAFGLMLINRGLYWDDWVIYRVAPEWRTVIFSQSSRPIYGMLFNFLFSITNEVWLMKAIGFITLGLTGIIFYHLLLRIKGISYRAKVFLMILFALFPINSARISITMTHYSISYFIFFAGIGLTLRYLESRNIFYRVAALIFFFLSFNMSSLLVFYGVVLLFITYLEWSTHRSFGSLKTFWLKHPDFILLPIMFFVIRVKFFKPYGLYLGYNEVSFQGILNSPQLIKVAFKHSFIDILKKTWITTATMPIAFIITCALSFVILAKITKKKLLPKRNEKLSSIIVCGVLGFVCFVLGVFPYIVLQMIPDSNSWDSRHQILLGPAAAFLLFAITEGGIFLLQKFRQVITQNSMGIFSGLIYLRLFVYSSFFSAFIVMNFDTLIVFQKDWYKKAATMNHFSQNETIKENTAFLIDEQLPNIFNSPYSYYEYTGMLKLVFGDEKRYASPDETLFRQSPEALKEHFGILKRYPQYNVSEFKFKPYEYLICVQSGKIPFNSESIRALLLAEYINPDQFRQDLKELVSLSVHQIDGERVSKEIKATLCGKK